MGLIDLLTGIGTFVNGIATLLTVFKKQSAPDKKQYNAKFKYGLLDKNLNFVGRTNELKQISKYLKKKNKITIYGTGGYGKTQLANHYAHKNEKKYKCIIRINASSHIELKSDYKEIARQMGIAYEKNNPDYETILNDVNTQFTKYKNCLLIYDNVESLESREPYKEPINKYMPSNNFNGHILICTQKSPSDKNKAVEIGIFSDFEAKDFLEKSITGINNKEIKKLSNELGRLPLALSSAATYINNGNAVSVEGYISSFKEEIAILDASYKDDYDKIITTTWILTAKLLSEEARQFFNLCAYCSSSKIPLSLFIGGSSHLPPPLSDKLSKMSDVSALNHNPMLNELTKYNLLTRTTKTQSSEVYIHVHKVIQKTMVHTHKKNLEKLWLECCLNVARYNDYNSNNSDNVAKIRNALTIANYARKSNHITYNSISKIRWIYKKAKKVLNRNRYFSEEDKYLAELEYVENDSGGTNKMKLETSKPPKSTENEPSPSSENETKQPEEETESPTKPALNQKIKKQLS